MKKGCLFILGIVLLLSLILSIPEIMYSNSGQSKVIGSVRNGELENAWLLPYRGSNFSYFSPLSYYLMNNAYTHSAVHNTVLDAYELCEKTCPGVHFRVMECSDKSGGKMLFHRTHQNGMSVDFMVPKINGKKQSQVFDRIGMWHYLLEFHSNGSLKLHKNTSIDFESMAKHLLALDEAARKNGLRIRKVILNTELKDELYATKEGALIRDRGIYIVRSLSPIVNKFHDDHYHVDFEFL